MRKRIPIQLTLYMLRRYRRVRKEDIRRKTNMKNGNKSLTKREREREEYVPRKRVISSEERKLK